MCMKKIVHRHLLWVLCVLVTLPAQAHEMWLMPTKFKLQKQDSLRIAMRVGMNFAGEVWNYEPDKLITMRRISDGKMLIMDKAIPSGRSEGVKISAGEEGTSMIIFGSRAKTIVLQAKEFNSYLRDEGLRDILALRTKKKELDKPVRELYARCAKTILQTGILTNDVPQYATGLEYELIPLTNPYDCFPGDTMAIAVLWRNKPIVNAFVQFWHRTKNEQGKDSVIKLQCRTDSLGNAVMRIPRAGAWLVSSVQMIPHTATKNFDYESYWASLTFEIQERKPVALQASMVGFAVPEWFHKPFEAKRIVSGGRVQREFVGSEMVFRKDSTLRNLAMQADSQRVAAEGRWKLLDNNTILEMSITFFGMQSVGKYQILECAPNRLKLWNYDSTERRGFVYYYTDYDVEAKDKFFLEFHKKRFGTKQ